MKITDRDRDVIRLLEARNPGCDIEDAIKRTKKGDFAAMVFELAVDLSYPHP